MEEMITKIKSYVKFEEITPNYFRANGIEMSMVSQLEDKYRNMIGGQRFVNTSMELSIIFFLKGIIANAFLKNHEHVPVNTSIHLEYVIYGRTESIFITHANLPGLEGILLS